MIGAMDELVDRLRAALQEQWEWNHAEHCTNMEHQPGERCSWPKPRVLQDVPTNEYRHYDDGALAER